MTKSMAKLKRGTEWLETQNDQKETQNNYKPTHKQDAKRPQKPKITTK